MPGTSPLHRAMPHHKVVRAEMVGEPATAVAGTSTAKPTTTPPGAVIQPPTTTTTTPPVVVPPKTTSSVSPTTTSPPATTSSSTTTVAPPLTTSTSSLPPVIVPPLTSSTTTAPPVETTPEEIIPSTTEIIPPIETTSETAAPSAIGNAPAASSSGFTSNTLIGVIVGGAVFVILLVGCCWFMGRQRRRRKHIRSALDDDVLGPGGNWRRRTQRLSRSGWRQPLEPEPKDLRIMSPSPDLTPFPPNRYDNISHGEARESVRMQYPMNNFGAGVPPTPGSRGDQRLFVPPSRSHPAYNYPNSERSSMWADTSEADMYANDGSTIARTISTDTRPNSEYNLENDPGATFHQARIVQPHGMMQAMQPSTHSVYSDHSGNTFGGGTYRSAATSGAGGHGGFAPMAYPPSQLGTYQSSQGFFPASGSSTYMSGSTMSPISPTPSHGFYEVGANGRAPVPVHQQQPQQHQRIPAPRVLVDQKQPIAWPEDPLSPTGAGSSQWASQSSTSLLRNAAVPASNSPISPDDPRSRSVTSPTMDQPSPSFATQTRPLVVPRAAANADLPYSTTVPGPAPGDPAVLAAVAATATATPSEGASLSRGQTIVRHADGGAFDDAVPDGDVQGGTLHLPPAYGDIYGPSEPGPA